MFGDPRSTVASAFARQGAFRSSADIGRGPPLSATQPWRWEWLFLHRLRHVPELAERLNPTQTCRPPGCTEEVLAALGNSRQDIDEF
jgi:hypothetical protein